MSASLLHAGELSPGRQRRLMALALTGAEGLQPGPDHPRALLLGLATLGWAEARTDGTFHITTAGRDVLAAAKSGRSK